MHKKIEKVHKECFAQHVDGAPFKILAVQRLIVAPFVKCSLHQGSNDVLDKLGAVDGAPSTCCAKHSSVNFFIFFGVVFQAKKSSMTYRRPPKASWGLPEPF